MTSVIVEATLSEMAYLMESAKKEGWNPGLEDALPFYFSDTTGFFIEKLNGEPIGCISAVAHTDTYGFLGFYVVAPPYRHKGYGLALWNQAIKHLGKRTMGLDGVVTQQENYGKSGFQFFYNNLRFSGKVRGVSDGSLQPVNTLPFKSIVDFDKKVIGYDRSIFLQHFTTMPNCCALAKVEKGNLVGYGVIRKCVTGYKIGPLFAEDPATAEQIFLGLSAPVEGSDIFLDIIDTHSHALELAARHGLKKVGETARMYKGTPPRQKIENIFAVSTLELG
jgi:GNAT superfamily N-acetyltransferase